MIHCSLLYFKRRRPLFHLDSIHMEKSSHGTKLNKIVEEGVLHLLIFHSKRKGSRPIFRLKLQINWPQNLVHRINSLSGNSKSFPDEKFSHLSRARVPVVTISRAHVDTILVLTWPTVKLHLTLFVTFILENLISVLESKWRWAVVTLWLNSWLSLVSIDESQTPQWSCSNENRKASIVLSTLRLCRLKLMCTLAWLSIQEGYEILRSSSSPELVWSWCQIPLSLSGRRKDKAIELTEFPFPLLLYSIEKVPKENFYFILVITESFFPWKYSINNNLLFEFLNCVAFLVIYFWFIIYLGILLLKIGLLAFETYFPAQFSVKFEKKTAIGLIHYGSKNE